MWRTLCILLLPPFLECKSTWLWTVALPLSPDIFFFIYTIFLSYFPFLSYSLLFSCSVVSDSLWPHGLQHIRLPCPLPPPGVCSDSCPLSWWCCLTISPSATRFSFCLQSFFPASGSFAVSRLFASGGQSVGVSTSTSALPMNIQCWFPLGLTGLIFLQSKGLSRSSPALLFESINSCSYLFFFFCPILVF